MTNLCSMEKCERVWLKDIKRVDERINGISTALSVQTKELERRMHESNDLKKEFGAELDTVERKVDRLESRYGFGITAVVIGFTIFQVVLQILFKFLK